jgi:SNF2 family DNA or RNA helicase
VLRDPDTSPLELLKYNVVLVSYAFVMSQYRKLYNFIDGVTKFKNNGSGGHLERPSVSIFSEIFHAQEGVKCPYLVLDEVTAVKNPKGITFAAVEELRSLADMCIMLTGSPVDNTWMDLFAYLQFVLGHNIRSRRLMLSLFASRTVNGKLQAPKGNYFRRLLQLLNSFIVRRPEDIIELPALHEKTVTFSLAPEEVLRSDYHFNIFRTIVNINSADAVRLPDEGALPPWKRLTLAMQYAMHPAMVLIMHISRNPLAKGNDQASADVLYEAKDIERWTAWREELKKADNWKSSRITALIDIFNDRRDIDPACSVLIFDESVYFLDIVQIAFENMYDPVDCLRYDGREIPEKRTAILQEFEKAAGAKVLLISRAAGGIGLNITAANVVILCGPWWKSEWEQQAIKRAHRPGQTREVLAIKMEADNCALEAYKVGVRDKKNRHNSQIVRHITRKDGVVPKVWDDLD